NRGPRANPEVELFEIPSDRPSHVVVTYAPGRLVAYLNGEKVMETDSVQGDFFHWRDYPLVIGDEWGGGGDWRGTLEGVAIYDRVLGGEEVRENFGRYRAKIAARPEAQRFIVRERLTARSKTPTLEEISPYREGLVVYEYDVLEVLEGDLAAERIRVAHWAILDGRILPMARAAKDSIFILTLEPFRANPQLASLYRSETLEPAATSPLLYAPDPGLG
ncbi:MAG: LamG-like jellyroll fold domain-containing protein, partial [Thermoanaerobaculia bacterium]